MFKKIIILTVVCLIFSKPGMACCANCNEDQIALKQETFTQKAKLTGILYQSKKRGEILDSINVSYSIADQKIQDKFPQELMVEVKVNLWTMIKKLFKK